MRRFELTDEQWERVEKLLPGRVGCPGRSAEDNRLFLDAVLWIVRTGAPWRDLPERFGPWNSVFQRFNRWAKKGVWQQVFAALQEADWEWVMLDATIIRAHVHAAGARKKGGDQQLGRSRGGFGTKVHAVCDGLGNPVKLLLTPGQTHDVTQAVPLLEGLTAEHVIADKGYDSEQVRETIERQGATAVIPSRSNRKVQRAYDQHLYRERNQVERLFAKLKQCRRIATRYDKTARNYLALLHLAATMILLA
ncbi:IS5 family transposase [Aeoliella sp. SH292]|uniref:IS5 family transposase n=1 Tax=Aeoliella sp. SH292 TaxID=3454464 RepID=UPI003F9B5FD2